MLVAAAPTHTAHRNQGLLTSMEESSVRRTRRHASMDGSDRRDSRRRNGGLYGGGRGRSAGRVRGGALASRNGEQRRGGGEDGGGRRREREGLPVEVALPSQARGRT